MPNSYYKWRAGRKGGDEDTIVCLICLDERYMSEYSDEDEDSLRTLMENHIEQGHCVTGDELTVFEVREREIIGVETDWAASDCDGPHSSYGTRRLPSGQTWSQYVGREVTNYPPENIVVHRTGLRFSYGGPTDEGSSSTCHTAIFRSDEWMLDEPDTQRDVFAEQMNY